MAVMQRCDVTVRRNCAMLGWHRGACKGVARGGRPVASAKRLSVRWASEKPTDASMRRVSPERSRRSAGEWESDVATEEPPRAGWECDCGSMPRATAAGGNGREMGSVGAMVG